MGGVQLGVQLRPPRGGPPNQDPLCSDLLLALALTSSRLKENDQPALSCAEGRGASEPLAPPRLPAQQGQQRRPIHPPLRPSVPPPPSLRSPTPSVQTSLCAPQLTGPHQAKQTDESKLHRTPGWDPPEPHRQHQVSSRGPVPSSDAHTVRDAPAFIRSSKTPGSDILSIYDRTSSNVYVRTTAGRGLGVIMSFNETQSLSIP